MSLIKDAIVAGSIQSGEYIVEGKIAQQLGVGQGLIREALIELEHQGFVQRTPYSGTQVPKLSHEDAIQIFDVRIQLEPWAFQDGGRKMKPADRRDLQNLLAKAKLDADQGNLDRFLENHLPFRQKIWDLTGNKYLQQTLERLVPPLYALYLRGEENRHGLQQTVNNAVRHKTQILECYESGHFEQAGLIAREFLIEMQKTLVAKLRP